LTVGGFVFKTSVMASIESNMKKSICVWYYGNNKSFSKS